MEDKANHPQECKITYPRSYQNFLATEEAWEEFDSLDEIFEFLRKSTIGPQGINLKKINLETFIGKDIATPRPISPGIFKGTYGGHGIEIIAIDYPTEDTLKAVKLTGDPNVPMNKVTFTADLTKGIALTKDEQKQLSCDDLKK